MEKSKRIKIINPVDLREASLSTNSDGNINPARDGVFARVRSAMLRYGSAAAVGSVVGAGGMELKNHLFSHEKKITQVNDMEKDDNSNDNIDKIVNRLDTKNVTQVNQVEKDDNSYDNIDEIVNHFE